MSSGQKSSQSHQRLRSILRCLLDPVVTINKRGMIQDASDSVFRDFGWKPGELIGKNIKLLMPEPHFSQHDQYLLDYFATGHSEVLNRTREFDVVRKDGSIFTCELSVSEVEIESEDEHLYVGSFRDISARKESERVQRETQRRLEAIFDQEIHFVGLLETDGRLIEVNRAALRSVGVTREEVVGRFFWDTPWWANSESDCERLKDAVQRARNGEHVRFETSHTRIDGMPLSFDFSLRPVKDETGRVVLLVPEGHNTTDLRRAERREDVMLRSLATLGESASMLAHEIKNPLTGLNVALRALADKLDTDQQEILDDLASRLRGLDSRLRRALSFSKPNELNLRAVDPAAQLQFSGLAIRSEVLDAGHEFRMNLTPDLPAVLLDPALFDQVIENLVRNALEAQEGQAGIIQLSIQAGGDGWVVFQVDDAGPGIPASQLRHLFKPFYTTRSEGTGVGLAMVKKVIQEHGGKVSVSKSELGGSRFSLRLPTRESQELH